MKIAVIISEFNGGIVGSLVSGMMRGLDEAGIKGKAVEIFRVPGAFEIPYQAQLIADSKKFDGAIALGCVIRGETDHYQAVCDGVTYGLQKVSIESRFPIMFGVLMCKTVAQARARSGKNNANKGYECARALLKFLK